MVGVPRPFWETRKNHVKIGGVGVGAVWASKVTQIGVPGDPRGCKNHKNFDFLVDPSVQKYDHAGSRNGVIRCQTALWSGPTAPPGPR